MRLLSIAATLAAVMLATTPGRAAVIADTPTLPLLGVPYANATGVGCFPLAGVCISAGSFVLTSIVSSSFDADGQDILTGVSFNGTLTDLANVPIGPIALAGTLEQKVLGRTFATELGSWDIDLVAVDLSGPVLGFTLSLGLDDAHDSTGFASIKEVVGEASPRFRIDSFFDVFVELSLDSPTPLTTTRGPLRLTLLSVPEPAMPALLFAGLVALALGRRRLA